MSRGTLDPAPLPPVSLTGLSPSLAGLPSAIPLHSAVVLCGPNPGMRRIPVWAPSISLAATLEITVVFFSSGYLDVSVRRVPLHYLFSFHLFSNGYMDSFHVGSPIQISAALWIFAPPRSFSQLITSFIGS